MKHFSFKASESNQKAGTNSLLNAKNNLTAVCKKGKSFGWIVIFSIFATSCKKGTDEIPDVLDRYTGLNSHTLSELREARDASAHYRNLENALADGYTDIAVNTEHMGHHFMKASLVDSIFDRKKPEILVYNKDENGKSYLVAIEYAVPLDMPKPEGFTGSADVWDGNTGFQLWLLHAWVWNFNPDGIFHPTNPSIHLH